MFEKDRPKDPRKVAAGRAAPRKLTAGMSPEEYRAFQQRCRQGALASNQRMQQQGAHSANDAQLREWGLSQDCHLSPDRAQRSLASGGKNRTLLATPSNETEEKTCDGADRAICSGGGEGSIMRRISYFRVHIR